MITRRLFIQNSASALCAATTLPLPATANNPLSYRIVAGKGKAALLENPDLLTDVWAFNGKVPGPTIRLKKGEETSITVVNNLDQPTSVHWHGIRLDNAMDGVSNLTQEPIQPGESFEYRFVAPDAGTYWYHPHNRTWEQLARGLYGALIVEGDAPDNEFDRDYTVIADDWRLETQGAIHEESLGSLRDWSHAGRLGNTLTLNGKPYEMLDVNAGERVRLRLANSANARIMRFGIEGHKTWLVALDGQPITPVRLMEEGIQIAPAQRADLVFDVQGKAGEKIAIVETSGDSRLAAGYLNVGAGSSGTENNSAPGLIPNHVPEPDMANAQAVELVMSGGAMRFLSNAVYQGVEMDGRTLAQDHGQLWAFNGQAGMSDMAFFAARRGTTISLKIVNQTLWPHAIHLHGHHFKVLKRGAASTGILPAATGEETEAFRDTVLVERDEIVEVAFVADNPGKWMLHCHMLEHQASGMGTWFEVS